jgi:NitT/TauT family transport system permease protein/taurine transport system permease protein
VVVAPVGDGKLMLNYFPQSSEEVPGWGRVRLIHDAVAANHALPLDKILKFPGSLHFTNDYYAWCWAAAIFLDEHPRYQKRFRELYKDVLHPDFNTDFYQAFAKDLPELCEEWQVFIAGLEYGYDIPRTVIDFTPGKGVGRGGILTGALVGGIAALRNLMLPVFSSLYAVPIVILYPIFTAWFGIGSESKIAFAGIYGFFPVMLSTAAGIRTIDQHLLLAARSMGATLPQQVVRVIIPASIPTVLAGLRLGGALAIIGVVVAEMLTSAAGIGYLVSKYRTVLDSPRVFAAILMILVLSVLFDQIARAIERRTLAWQTAGRRERGAPVRQGTMTAAPAPA